MIKNIDLIAIPTDSVTLINVHDRLEAKKEDYLKELGYGA